MIKFFRKIRQRLLSESKFSRYLLYAMGEIVLVMIGILMALQINNWNEQRKLQNTNEVLLSKLVGELDLNIDRMIYLDSNVSENGISSGLKTISLNLDTALNYMANGLDSTKIEWLLIANLIQGSTLNLQTSVYEEMKNTGRLYSLGSDSLLHEINRYYGRLEREAYYNDNENRRQFERWTECKYGYLLLRMDYMTRGISALENHPWCLDQKAKNYQNLRFAINTSSRITKQNRGRMKAVIEESKALKTELLNLLNSEK